MPRLHKTMMNPLMRITLIPKANQRILTIRTISMIQMIPIPRTVTKFPISSTPITAMMKSAMRMFSMMNPNPTMPKRKAQNKNPKNPANPMKKFALPSAE